MTIFNPKDLDLEDLSAMLEELEVRRRRSTESVGSQQWSMTGNSDTLNRILDDWRDNRGVELQMTLQHKTCRTITQALLTALSDSRSKFSDSEAGAIRAFCAELESFADSAP